MATATRVTLEEFLAIPEFDEKRLELLDGEVYEKPMPNAGHTDIAAYLTIHTARFGRPRGELRAMIPASSDSDASSPLPDFVLFVGDHPKGKEWMTFGSTIAVEIMSPGQRRLEMRRKIDMYIAFGVKS